MVRDSKTGIGKGFGFVNFKNKDSVVLALEKNEQTLNEREVRIKTYKYNLAQKPLGKGKKEKKSKFQKQDNTATSPKRAQKPDNGGKPNRKGPPNGQTKEFKGELASKKKLAKKSLKNRIKSSKIIKQKKNIAEILCK